MNSWWYTLIAGLALLGYLLLFVEILQGILKWFVGLFHRTNVNVVYVDYDVHQHRDPTRPNFTEDESAAWLNVTRKMEQFERRAIEGKVKSD